MDREREDVTARGRLQHPDTVATARVDDDLPRPERARRRQPGDETGEVVVGHREEDEVGGCNDVRHLDDRYAGEQVSGPRPGRLAHRGHRDDVVTGPRQRGTEDGTDAAGADDADPEAGWSLRGVARVAHAVEPTSWATGPRRVPDACPDRGGWSLDSDAMDTEGGARLPRVERAPVPWDQAWQTALYGTSGFYRGPAGPAGHFTTATHGGPGRVLARALLAWADLLGCDGIIDVGAGRGELLTHLYGLAPHRPLTGVDVVGRPEALSADVRWLTSRGGSRLPDDLRPAGALVVAHEWLDVVPCPVVEVDIHGRPRVVLVDAKTGAETLGPELQGADLEWCQRFWPDIYGDAAEPGRRAKVGRRAEVGRARDLAWSALLRSMDGGAAIAVDYGHTAGDRPLAGSLMAYRSGEVVATVPDGCCDLTAHVAVDSLRHDELLRQREALHRVGVSGRTPDHATARTDPAGYLAALAVASHAAVLLAPGGFGDFWWVVARP